MTVVPKVKVDEQTPGQETPLGELVTVPLPVMPTLRVSGGPSWVSVAFRVPEDPKLTDMLPDLVGPEFCVTLYGVVQVMS